MSHSSRTDKASHTSCSRLQLSFFPKSGPAIRSGGHTRSAQPNCGNRRAVQSWEETFCSKLSHFQTFFSPFNSAWKTFRLRLPFTTVPTVAATAGYILLEFSFSQNAMVDKAPGSATPSHLFQPSEPAPCWEKDSCHSGVGVVSSRRACKHKSSFFVQSHLGLHTRQWTQATVLKMNQR